MELAIITFLLLTSAVTGAVFYRMRGGKPSLPRPVEQVLFCIVFGMSMDVLAVSFGWQVVGFALAVGLCLTGHGLYFLAKISKPIEPETFDFLLLPFFGPDPRCDKRFSHFWGEEEAYLLPGYDDALDEIKKNYSIYGAGKIHWRCVAGMALTGGLVSLFPGLIVSTTTEHTMAGITLALSGFVSKGLAYYVCDLLGYGTEESEYSYGALQWFLAVLVVVLAVMIL